MIDVACNRPKGIFKGSDQREIGGSGVTSTPGTWYGGVVMGVLLSFNEAAILYRDLTVCIEISTVRHHKSKI
jgi:hypothetical protein